MQNRPSIGIVIDPTDPYWVQVYEATLQRATQLQLAPIPFHRQYLVNIHGEYQAEIISLILDQDLQGIVAAHLPLAVLQQLVYHQLPVVYLDETTFSHPYFTSTIGLYKSAQVAGSYVAEQLGSQGHVLVISEVQQSPNRLQGVLDSIKAHPPLRATVCQVTGDDYAIYCMVGETLKHVTRPIDAIIGCSDILALIGGDAFARYGPPAARPLVVGINGDPFALGAIVNGKMDATVDIAPTAIGTHAIDLVAQAIAGQSMPPYLSHCPVLVTGVNIPEVATQKLIALTSLPTRLAALNRQIEQQRILQHERRRLSGRTGQRTDEAALLEEKKPSLPPQTSALVQRAVAYMQVNFMRSITRDTIAAAVDVSDGYLARIFHEELQLTLWEYLNRYRIQRACELLQNTHESIRGVAASVGFADPSYFGRVFRTIVGCSPQQYRKRMK